MEAFEHVVKVYLESLGYVVTAGVKFPVLRTITKKSGRIEHQRHGYEVDLVAARYGELILGSVKSYLGSRGVNRQGFPEIADPSKRTHFKRYTMFNDSSVRDGILTGASELYGYPLSCIRMALYVGKFCRSDEEIVRSHLCAPSATRGAIGVVGLAEIVQQLRAVAERKTYLNDPVVMTLKVLNSAGVLSPSSETPSVLPSASEDEIEDGDDDDDDASSE